MPQVTAADAGCWLDGSMGWHNTYRVAERAFAYGWLAGSPADKAATEQTIEAYKAYRSGDRPADSDVMEVMEEICDDATDYLNTLAPEGYVFMWDAGDLSLVPDDETD